MTDTAMRDAIFLGGHRSEHNESRIAVTRLDGGAGRLAEQDSSTGLMYRWDKTLNNNTGGGVRVPAAAKRSELAGAQVYTTLRYEDLSAAEALPRVGGAGLPGAGTPSNMEKRRDVLSQHPETLGALYVPTRFERGVPFKIYNGSLYVNTYVMAEHAALVVEMSAYLAPIPGIFRGHYGAVPASFRPENVLLADARGSAEAPAAAATSASGGSDGGVRGVDEVAMITAEARTTTVRLDASEVPGVADETVRRVHNPAPASGSASARGGDALVDHNATLLREEAEGLLSDDAKVPQMPYLPDMLAKFLTLQAGSRLVKDAAARQWVKALHEDYFVNVQGAPTYEELCRDEVQLSMRFAGAPPHADAVELYPLSLKLPVVETAVLDADRHRRQGRGAGREGHTLLTEQYLSFYEGRKIESNDEEFLNFQAARFGRQAIKNVEGNVFAMSTWHAYTVRALEERGMIEARDRPRVNDAGHFVLNRIRMMRGKRNRDKHVEETLQKQARIRAFLNARKQRREQEAAAAARPETNISDAALRAMHDRHNEEAGMDLQYESGELPIDPPETPAEAKEREAREKVERDKENARQRKREAKKREREEREKDWTDAERDEAEAARTAKTARKARDAERYAEYKASLHLDLPSLHREFEALPGTWKALERRQATGSVGDDAQMDAARSERKAQALKRKWQEEERMRRAKAARLPVRRVAAGSDDDDDDDACANDESMPDAPSGAVHVLG